MRQYLIDTNYLLRFLLRDIPAQSKIVRDYFIAAEKHEIQITVPLLVFVEIDFALRKLYSFKKEKVIKMMREIMDNISLSIEKKELLVGVLQFYSSKNISFVDAIFCYQARLENKELLTFDRKLQKMKI